MRDIREAGLGRCVWPLEAIALDGKRDFGVKAATLGHLKARGFDVPDGFCIRGDAFSRDPDDPMDAAVVRQILSAYRDLGGGSVAVRSSARDEDLALASAAGIYDSLLNVMGEQALLDAVRHCLASLDTPAACGHRLAQGRADEAGAMGVLVQRMVLADVAGVAYTLDPVTGRRDRLCLNVNRGLGDALTSGHVSGETLLTDRAGALAASDHPGAVEPALGPEARRALAALAELLETELGGPLDIEFALEGDRLRLLQARPVAIGQLAAADCAARLNRYLDAERARLRARLDDLRAQGILRVGEAVLSNGNIAELLPNATPLSLDLFNGIFTAHGGAIARGRQRLGYRVPDAGAEALLETFCGQPYFNVEVDARTYDAGYPLDIAGYLASVQADPALASYPELGLYEQVPTLAEACRRFGRVGGSALYRKAVIFQDRLRRKAEVTLDRWHRHDRVQLEREAARASAIDWPRMDVAEVVGQLRGCVRYLREVACVDFVVAARLGFFFAERIRVALDGLQVPETDGLHSRLLQGLDGSRITDLSLDLERLGRGELSLADWLADYGHLAPNELELSSPRYIEMPATIEGLANRLATSTPTPSARHAQQRQDRARADATLDGLLGFLGRTRAAKLRQDIRLARAFLPLRETIKLHYTAQHAAFRRGLLRLAELRGLEPELAFYLRLDELAEAPNLVQLQTRREERQLGRRLLRQGRLPAVIHEGRISALGAEEPQAQAERLSGRAMAPGRSVGRVRILDLDADDPQALLLDLGADEVLVTRSANLGLASLLRGCAGLVVEVGGVLAHAACQARESGIPAVALENATRLLHDGMRVRLDGATGSVSILTG
ncbi:PEP/pyruvate-binding domain-containing protein [Thiorhodococcus minor]|uniref:Pyruvate phosphate dikinase n=1 Tax=Thiorhodococcus minor TaxID=57489 RepID=A0A6M0K4U7_9GAMM|nr:PEP/pyruvate-binding domain-containing protein [Thiorhodococcus minor]NEV63933.1 pyruvate phosphate dikinase [Thiorhodococcus minor]